MMVNPYKRKPGKVLVATLVFSSLIYLVFDNNTLRARHMVIRQNQYVQIIAVDEVVTFQGEHGVKPREKSNNVAYRKLLDSTGNVNASSKQPNKSSTTVQTGDSTGSTSLRSGTYFFHQVTQLRPDKDLRIVVTGPQDFSQGMASWQKHMQQFYWNLFTRENADFDTYALNSTLSETLPILRDIPDNRLPECQHFVARQNLPKVSIIIPFHNEQYSFLVRTLHSILDKTPASLIQEIILIDDASDQPNLLQAFPVYVRQLPKVRLYRTLIREGLIRARLLGAMKASAPVLVFLDAHIECQQQWLEPLLQIVTENASSIAIPAISEINTTTLDFGPNMLYGDRGDARSITGIFDWELNYVWAVDAYPDKHQSPLTPVPTATIIGCAMVVNKEFFFEMGAYDENMYIWGGENLEISFRTWMCGGSIHMAPCSVIGHVFRRYLPYTFPHENQVLMNLHRVAEVWMDEYKSIFYQVAHKPFELSPKEVESLEIRKQLRSRLQCRSFKWYRDSIASKVISPNIGDLYFGRVNSDHGCLTLMSYGLDLYSCMYSDSRQHFALTADKLVRSYSGSCLRCDLAHRTVDFTDCKIGHPGMLWSFEETKGRKGLLSLTQGDQHLCFGYAASKQQPEDDIPQYLFGVGECDGSSDINFMWSFSHRVLE